MPSDLSDFEKEDREVESLLRPKPAPSRKHRERRAPRPEQRKTIIKESDPDMSSSDKDMSLNRKDIGSRIQPSYVEVVSRIMKSQVSTYHGVLGQGHPSGPTNTPHKLDKRYFDKSDYTQIVKTAKDLLADSWFKHGWDSGSPDAPIRAALDIAISTMSDSLYQSKIDVETYNMLLGTLSDDKTDQFSETLIPDNGTDRKASSDAVSNILRIASDVRHTDPGTAFQIVQKLQETLKMNEIRVSEDLDHQNRQMENVIKEVIQSITSNDIGEYVDGIRQLSALVQKSASSRTASVIDLAPLEDMSDEEVKNFLGSQKMAWDRAKKFFDDGDVKNFMESFDKIIDEASKTSSSVKTSSIQVSISSLLRMASASEEAKDLLQPLLLAAKKKIKKKDKPKKTSQKEKEEPSDSKKAPPFEKKKPGKPVPPQMKKPAKKRRAFSAFTSEDLEW